MHFWPLVLFPLCPLPPPQDSPSLRGGEAELCVVWVSYLSLAGAPWEGFAPVLTARPSRQAGRC